MSRDAQEVLRGVKRCTRGVEKCREMGKRC